MKTQFTILNSQFNSPNLPEDSKWILENFDKIIQNVKPLNSKQMQLLPENIRSLSHQMTDDRSKRRLGYMNENIQLSAYVRYFTWWNLVRLTRLFSNLNKDIFPSTDAFCLDLGSGPLTVISALWLARAELRKLKLTWYCLDVSQNSMALGEDIYLSIVANTSKQDEETSPWKIIRVKGSFGTSIKNKCSFITCANMLNELDQASNMPPEFQTKKYFDQLKIYSDLKKENDKTTFLLVEPGVPKAARTLCLLRERFIKEGFLLNSPCPHHLDCPMNGFKSYTGSKHKWCNFAFDTQQAPEKLKKLSTAAKLPKDRATLSYICASKSNSPLETEAPEDKEGFFLLRIVSDQFKLPQNKAGFYGCSKFGLTLIKTSLEKAKNLNSGTLLKISFTDLKTKTPDLPIDEKSGAKIIIL